MLKKLLFFFSSLTYLSSFTHCAEKPVLESVLDHKDNICLDICDIPKVQSLCDGLRDLQKGRIPLRDGAFLYYEEEGAGIPIVLLAGGPGNSHHGFHPHFSTCAKFARTIYFDFRGCGQSYYDPNPIKTYSVDQALDDLEDMRKHLGIDKWFVLGHSNGGLIAQCYAKKYPASIAGLILVCSAFDKKIANNYAVELESNQRSLMTDKELQRQAEINTYFEPQEAVLNKNFLKNEITREEGNVIATNIWKNFTYNSLLNGDWKRQYMYRPTNEEMAQMVLYNYTFDWGYIGVMEKAQEDWDLSAFDGSIPTMILEGKHDLTWNAKHKSKTLQNIHPHAQCIMFENSAHSPFIDEPDLFFDCLNKFVNPLH